MHILEKFDKKREAEREEKSQKRVASLKKDSITQYWRNLTRKEKRRERRTEKRLAS